MAPCEWVIDILQAWVTAKGYATEAWVTAKGYATEAWVTAKGYATEAWVTAKGYATEAWVTAKGYATEAWVTAKGYLTTSFVRRVSQAAYDWTQANLTEDGNWHELDCSPYVPTGAKAILFEVQIRNSAIDKRLRLRYPGDANAPGWLRFNTQVANIYRHGEMIMSCDADRKVEYYFTAGGWTGERISILGWWL